MCLASFQPPVLPLFLPFNGKKDVHGRMAANTFFRMEFVLHVQGPVWALREPFLVKVPLAAPMAAPHKNPSRGLTVIPAYSPGGRNACSSPSFQVCRPQIVQRNHSGHHSFWTEQRREARFPAARKPGNDKPLKGHGYPRRSFDRRIASLFPRWPVPPGSLFPLPVLTCRFFS